MFRTAAIAIASLTLVAGTAPALAAPCKDAKGKFIKCPAKPAAGAKRCKLNGKFAKCGTPGAKPV